VFSGFFFKDRRNEEARYTVIIKNNKFAFSSNRYQVPFLTPRSYRDYNDFLNGLRQWLIQYQNIKVDNVHCLGQEDGD